VSGSTSEDAVAPWANQTGQDDESHTEQDLTLEKLDDADDHEDDGDDPQQRAAHVGYVPFVGEPRRNTPGARAPNSRSCRNLALPGATTDFEMGDEKSIMVARRTEGFLLPGIT
jgi:hypothetical protein